MIYFEDNKIVQINKGDKEICRVYKGNQLVYTTAYNYFKRNTGTYTFTLEHNFYGRMLFVGNGGGGCSSQKDSQWWYASGGSGACFEGIVRLPRGTYTLVIGTLGYGNNANNVHWYSGGLDSTDSYLQDSNGNILITAGCGAKGNTNYTSTTGGVGGTLTLGTLNVVQTIKAVNGNQTVGNSAAGSLSAYDNTYTGYGAGTCGQRGQGNVYGVAGIFQLGENLQTLTFDAGTNLQSWTVPNGVSEIEVDCIGSQGEGTYGGKGGRTQCRLAVSAGDTLYFTVGGQSSSGLSAPTYNAADIRKGGTALQNRIIVAGGGGNQAYSGAAGGAGGGLVGADGETNGGYAGVGKGGTQSAGGAGGTGFHGEIGHHHDGNAGTFGLGGAGSYETQYEGASGAGGAGYYGGGAGAGSWNREGAYTAGGGGGSSYTSSDCSYVTLTQGYRLGNGYIKIYYVTR